MTLYRRLCWLLIAGFGVVTTQYLRAGDPVTQPSSPANAESPVTLPSTLYILEQVTDHYGEGWGLDNSFVAVNSRGVDRVVAIGPKAVPALLAIMEDDSLTFDTFTRAESALGQILYKIKPQTFIRWYGGVDEENLTPDGKFRVFRPSIFGQSDDPIAFRHWVVEDAIGIFKQLHVIGSGFPTTEP